MPKKPTSAWWNKTTKQIRKDNPSYSDKQVDETAGHIWYHNMSPSQKKKETKKSEGSVQTKAEHPISPAHKYPLRLDRDVVGILSLYHQGESDPLYQVVSRLSYNDQTRASDIELKAVLEELNNAISDFESELSGDEPDEHGAIDLSKLRDAKEKVQHILRTKRAHKVTAAELKNLFAKDYESWIQMEARLLAQNNFGTWSSLEEANQKIDEAIKELTQTLTKGIEPEVKRIVEEERKNILEEMEASITLGQEPGQEAIEAPPGEEGMPPAGEGELGELETKVDNLMPPGASKKAQKKSLSSQYRPIVHLNPMGTYSKGKWVSTPEEAEAQGKKIMESKSHKYDIEEMWVEVQTFEDMERDDKEDTEVRKKYNIGLGGKRAQIAEKKDEKELIEEHVNKWDKAKKQQKKPEQALEDLSDDDLDAFEKSLDEKLAAHDAKEQWVEHKDFHEEQLEKPSLTVDKFKKSEKVGKGLTQTDMTRVKKDKDTKKKENQKKEDKKTTDMFHSAQKKTRDEHLDELYNEFLKDDATDKVDLEKDKDITDAELDKLWAEMGLDDEEVEEYEDDDETWKHEGEEDHDRFAKKDE